MWQTCNHFLLKPKALGTLDRRVHHLSKQGGPKSPPHIFFVLANLDCFDLGTSLKNYALSQGSDVAYIGHWPRQYTFLIDIQTDSQIDRQTNMKADIYILPCLSVQTSYHCLSLDCLQTVSELFMYISKSTPVYFNVTFFFWGGGDA